MSADTRPAAASPFLLILVISCLILLVNFGLRSSYGLMLGPVSETFRWPSETFSLAIALQNLAWGLFQPVFGAIADKIGDRRALAIGAVCYAIGLGLSAVAVSPLGQFLTTGLLVGAGIAGTGFGVVLAIVGRAAPDEKRSQALGIAVAAGSAGQVLVVPFAAQLITGYGWQGTLSIFAVLICSVFLALPFLKVGAPKKPATSDERLTATLSRVAKDPDYILIFLGFFSCGFQLAFITAHFPRYVTEVCGSVTLGATAISVIGFANIIGSTVAGRLGAKYPKKYLLSSIYALRTVVTVAFLLAPKTPETVILFSVGMGLLWLATVPLTSGIIAHIYGLQYMGTLYGVVFFSHQLGSFLGVWLGGRLYDATGSYDLVWWVGVGVGAFSAIAHLPIRENRMAPA